MRATILILALLAAPLAAKEELVTLPGRDSVQLTIYNSEDLTLVRERRNLSFKQGLNRLQFSWANTLIDPTSVEMQPVGEAAKAAITLSDTSYPPQSHQMLIWSIDCKAAGAHQVEISYFTSGITWSAEYSGVVNQAEDKVELTAFLTVTNNSGEEYENASVRVVIGTINLVEKIINLAQPRGQFGTPQPPAAMPAEDARDMAEQFDEERAGVSGGMKRRKDIQKGGLSEYYIYAIGGQETIPNAWSKRLQSFRVADIPLKTVYRLEPAKFGPEFTKVLEFKNDEEHKLGKEPLPDGIIRLYKDHEGRLGFMGAIASKYIPKLEEVKVNVGPDAECTLAEKRLSLRKKDLTIRDQWLQGWTTVEVFEMEIKNFRARAVEAEIHRAIDGQFDFESEAAFEKETVNTQKIKLTLQPGETRKIRFTVTTRHGTNVR